MTDFEFLLSIIQFETKDGKRIFVKCRPNKK